jgi:putative hydrolase of the HAD superfamily
MTTTIRAVLFDLGNTLSVSASLSDTFTDLAGSPIAVELGLDDHLMADLGGEIDQSIADLYKGHSTDQPHWLDVWRRPLRRHGIELGSADIERLCRAHLGHFVRSCEVAPHSIPLLTYLREAAIPLGLVSNVTGPVEIFRDDLVRKGLAPYFSTVIWSGTVGYRKPDRRIFEIAIDKLGLEAGPHVAMVGDSEAADILGGKGMGFTTVKVGKAVKEAATAADYAITGPCLLEFFQSNL